MATSSDLRNRTLSAMALITVGVACLFSELTTLLFLIVLATVFCGEIAASLFKQPHNFNGSVLATVFLLFGLSGFMFAYYLRTQEYGIGSLVLIAVSVAFTDTFAYLGGRRYGTIRLAPKISPNKTVEGVVCGIAAGAVAFVLIWLLLNTYHKTSLPPASMAVLASGIPIISVLGDLLESSAKRAFGIKDFGTVLGAHGGVADRFDGMTVAFIAYSVVSLAIT
jgi:CDP-diglyceride synthetase